MKKCVLNALEIIIVDFLKEIITKFMMLKKCLKTFVNKTFKINLIS